MQKPLDRILVLEMVRVTEAAAIASAALIGRGDEKAADAAAVEAMRKAFNELDFDGTVVIGEGERDEAPMLFIGEKVGSGRGPKIDIALDPLEGTTITAKAGPNALSVLAIGEQGCLLNAPDTYMEKIAIRDGVPADTVSLELSPSANIARLANALGKSPGALTACVLDRPRHEALIAELRQTGCSVALIPDGDVAAAISVSDPASGVDIYIGTGGAPEGVLAAAGLACTGGQFQGRLVFRNAEERARGRRWGVEDPDKIYQLSDLVRGDVIFAATGVTDGSLLRGVHSRRGGVMTTESIVMRASSGTIRRVRSEHRASPRR